MHSLSYYLPISWSFGVVFLAGHPERFRTVVKFTAFSTSAVPNAFGLGTIVAVCGCLELRLQGDNLLLKLLRLSG